MVGSDSSASLLLDFIHRANVYVPGNFHALLAFRNDQELEVVKGAVHRMVHRALELDGTCTGEHGVGIGKKEYLAEELGEGTVELMRKIKRAIDPDNLFNPGKVCVSAHIWRYYTGLTLPPSFTQTRSQSLLTRLCCIFELLSIGLCPIIYMKIMIYSSGDRSRVSTEVSLYTSSSPS